MAEMLIDGAKLDACNTAEADAIRAKTGGSPPIPYDYANNKGFADAIAAIPSGGGTLRTTHYHGTLSYSNQVAYNPTVPVTGILSTDMVLVVLKLKRTGTVSDGVTTWNDELVVPSAFSSASVRLWVNSKAGKNFGIVSIKGTDGTTQNTFSNISSSVRAIYANSYGNDINIQSVSIGENGITLTQQGWNTRVCTTGVATEYEYDVYIMTEDGNAIVSGG